MGERGRGGGGASRGVGEVDGGRGMDGGESGKCQSVNIFYVLFTDSSGYSGNNICRVSVSGWVPVANLSGVMQLA